MIKIAICDDNLQERELLQRYINKWLGTNGMEYILYAYESGEEMYRELKNLHFDIVFLDIYMQDMTGTELAKEIRDDNERSIIIFTTSSREHAIEAYHFRAFQYLLKPLEEVEIQQVLKDSVRHLRLRKALEYVLPTQDGVRKIHLDEIYYIESSIRKTIIHLKNETFTCTYNINTLEEKLNARGFIRCHRSFIVNLNHIKLVKQGEVLLENDLVVYVSKYKQKEVKKRLVDYCGGII